LWQEKEGVKKYHLVNWQSVLSPHDMGGLGVTDLVTLNKCLLSKWLWKLENSDGLWQTVVRDKYLRNS
jgi:hypothetical protein